MCSARQTETEYACWSEMGINGVENCSNNRCKHTHTHIHTRIYMHKPTQWMWCYYDAVPERPLFIFYTVNFFGKFFFAPLLPLDRHTLLVKRELLNLCLHTCVCVNVCVWVWVCVCVLCLMCYPRHIYLRLRQANKKKQSSDFSSIANFF